MPLRAHISHRPDDGDLSYLRGLVDLRVNLTVGPELPESPRYEVLVAGRPKPEEIEASRRLRTLIIPFAGVPAVTQEVASGYPHLEVHNLHHNAAPTSEMAVTLLLSAAKRLVPMDQALRSSTGRRATTSQV